MPFECVLDTVVLRVMAFAHPDGIEITLTALRTLHVFCPAEVYNRDEDDQSLSDVDLTLSELGRGIRYARYQAGTFPGPGVTAIGHGSKTLCNSLTIFNVGIWVLIRLKSMNCRHANNSCAITVLAGAKPRV
jgi:hypothetical protein